MWLQVEELWLENESFYLFYLGNIGVEQQFMAYNAWL